MGSYTPYADVESAGISPALAEDMVWVALV